MRFSASCMQSLPEVLLYQFWTDVSWYCVPYMFRYRMEVAAPLAGAQTPPAVKTICPLYCRPARDTHNRRASSRSTRRCLQQYN